MIGLLPNMLERALAFVSPTLALKRFQARQSFHALSSYPISRDSGGDKGTMGNWVPQWLNRWTEGRNREKSATRARDLVANDPHAVSVVDSMAFNTVGTGLKPQSQPAADILGWSEDQVKVFQTQAEWAFHLWNSHADARGKLPFWAMQFQSLHSLLVNGEFLQLPVMLDAGSDTPRRKFSLALQSID